MTNEEVQKEQEQNQEVVQQDVRNTAPVETQKGVEAFLQQINDIPTVPTNVKNIAKQQAVSNSDNSNLATNQTQSSSNQSNSSSTSSENLGVRIVKKNSLEGDVNADLRDPMSNITQARVVEKNNLQGNVVADLREPVYEHKDETPKTEYRASAPVVVPETLLSVNNVVVNEGSPYAVFTVSGKANQSVSLGLAGQNSDGHDLTSLEYFNGNSWQPYVSGNVPLDSTGKLLVRVALSPEQETALDGPERFNLIATNKDGISSTGTGTIKDDGTGSYFAVDNNTGVSNVPNGVALDDDRPLSVNNISVNEASPYAVFEVSGEPNQKAALSLQNVTTTGLSGLQYFDGTSWTNYTAGTNVSLNSDGKLLVRISLTPEQETAQDNGETFTLTATNTGGTSSIGTATIYDDGTGTYYPDANPTNNTPATDPTHILDNDGPLSINDVSVNEASPYAVFTISGTVGDNLVLTLHNGTAVQGTTTPTDGSVDYSSSLQYFNGTSWVNYTANSSVTFPNGGTTLLVRTAIVNDTPYEGAQTFTLEATTNGKAATGTGIIKDDGTGDIFLGNNTSGTPNVSTDTGYPANLDDDRGIDVVSYGPVNETSQYAMFKVTGSMVGESLDLSLQNATSGTQATYSGFTTIQYSIDGGSHWTTYDSNHKPIVPNDGNVFVRVDITSERDDVYEGAEKFALKANYTNNTAITDFADTTIVDDGTGTKYDGTITSGNPTPDTTSLDDDRITLTFNDATMEEGSTLVFSGSLSNPSLNSEVITLSTTLNSADANDFNQDKTAWTIVYGSTSIHPDQYGKFTLPAGITDFNVKIPTLDDNVYEGAETFTLSASATSSYINTSDTSLGTIKDDGTGGNGDNINDETGYGQDPNSSDDDRPILSINDVTIIEGQKAEFTISIDKLSTQDITFSLTSVNGTAVANSDYTPSTSITNYEYSIDGSTWSNMTTNSLTISAGTSSLKVRVPTIDDTNSESIETFNLSANVTSGTVKNTIIGTATIIDNDGNPTFSINDITVNEATGTATLTVTLSPADANKYYKIDYTTQDGTAIYDVSQANNGDYTATSGTLIFAPNDTTKTISVTIGNDNIYEWSEYLNVILSNVQISSDSTNWTTPSYSAIADDTGTITIKDDGTGTGGNNNDSPTMSIDNVTVQEGSTLHFTGTVSNPIAMSMPIQISISPNTTTATGIDSLTNNSAIAADYGTIIVSYTNNSSQEVVIPLETSGSFSGFYIIPAMVTQLHIAVPSINDNVYEGSEQFNLNITVYDNNGNPYVTTGIGTITDVDSALSVNNISINEGSPYGVFTVTGMAGQSVKLSLTNVTATGGTSSPTDGTIDYRTSLEYNNGSGWSSYTPNSYVSIPNSGTVLVRTAIVNDTLYEGAETFKLIAINGSGISVNGIGTIHDDGTGQWFDGTSGTGSTTALSSFVLNDDRVLTVADANVNEASPYAVFEITAEVGERISLSLANGTATGVPTATKTDGTQDFTTGLQYWNGSAWTAYNSYVTVGSSGTVLVRNAIINDTLSEGAHTYTLTATYTSGTPKSDTGVATIYDDGTGDIFLANNNTSTPNDPTDTGYPTNLDDDRALSVNNISVNEGSGYAVFTVTGAVGQIITLSLADGTAIGGTTTPTNGTVDYNTTLEYWNGSAWTTYTPSSNITIDSSGKVFVRNAIVNDLIQDNGETFKLIATNTGGGNATGTATIYDDGTGFIYTGNISSNSPTTSTSNLNNDGTLKVNNVDVNEGSPYAVFTISGTVGDSLVLTLTNGTAIQGTTNPTDGSVDYSSTLQYWNGSAWTTYSSSVNIPTGGTLLVRTAIVNDTIYEGAEIFSLKVTKSDGGSAIGTGTIHDDGTGTYFPDANPTNSTTPATDSTHLLDDDRVIGISTLEDTNYTFSLSDFGTYSTSYTSVKILTLPTDGVIKLNGTAISANTAISTTDISSGKLIFVPTAQTDVDSTFTFQMGNGTTYVISNTMNVNITAVADMPSTTLNVGTNTGQFVDSGTNIITTTSTNNATLIQDLSSSVKTGVTYSMSFNYLDNHSTDTFAGQVEVYWGGEKVATVNGDKTISQTLTLDLVGGSGNGSNILEFRDTSIIHNTGAVDGMNINTIYMAPSQNMLEYNVNLSAALNTADRADGSETLSIKLSGYPDGTTFSVGYAEMALQWDPVLNTNTMQPTGNWIIPLSAITDDTYTNSGIKMYVPESAETFTLTSTAIATEANDNSTATAIATSSVVDYSLNVAPTSTNDSVTTLEDTTYTFTINDFGTYADDYNTAHPGLTSFTSIMITSLPTNGTLRLYGHDKFGSDADVQVGDQILVTDLTLGNLVFIPNSQYSGSAGSIGFQVGDGKVYSTSSYATTVSVTAVADMPSISITIGTAVAPNSSVTQSKVITESFGSSSSSNIGTWSGISFNSKSTTSGDLQANGTNGGKGTSDTGYYAIISAGTTATVTYGGFTPNSTVTIKFSSDAESTYSRNSSTNWLGTFTIKDTTNSSSPVTIYTTSTRTDIDGDITTSLYNGNSITAQVDANGYVHLSFNNGSTNSQKFDIDQLVITGTKTTTSSANTYDYPITITDSLGADKDGSESLGNVTLSGIPTGASLYSGTTLIGLGTSSVHSFTITQAQITAGNLVLKIPSANSQAFSLTASVTSTEISNGDSKIATATAEHSTGNTTPVTTNAVADLVTTSSTGSGSSPTNIVVIMDVSGSMSTTDSGTSASRLSLAKTAIENMITSYSAIGTVNVNLTSFQATATSYGWKTAANAITAIDGLSSGGYTNYEDAVYKTYTGYTDINSSAKTIVLFVSDGEPTRENLEGRDVTGDIGLDAQSGWLDTPYLDAWKTFINTYADELKVVGIGAGLTNMTYLDQLAQGINNSVVTDVVHLTNTADLATYVAPNVDSVYGNVLHNIDYKADGAGGIQSIVVNGTTYHSNVSSEVTALTNGVNTASSGEYGKLTFDFTTGDYKYTTANATTTDRTESFAITVADSNGTQSTFNLNVQVFNSSSDHTYVNSSTAIDAGSGYDSLILGSGINIDFSTNQSLSNFEQIDLLKNGDHTLSNINLQDIVSMTDSNNLLSILGDSADTISLKNTSSTVDVWSKSNTTPDANGFDTYINSGNNSVSLKIDHDIHVSII